MSGPGSASCQHCDLGEFWENYTCHTCPEDLHGDGVHCHHCPEGYAALEGLCFMAVHNKLVVIIGLTGLVVLLAVGLISGIVLSRRKVTPRTAAVDEQLNSIEMKKGEN